MLFEAPYLRNMHRIKQKVASTPQKNCVIATKQYINTIKAKNIYVIFFLSICDYEDDCTHRKSHNPTHKPREREQQYPKKKGLSCCCARHHRTPPLSLSISFLPESRVGPAHRGEKLIRDVGQHVVEQTHAVSHDAADQRHLSLCHAGRRLGPRAG